MRQVVCYTRVSTKEQGHNRNGLEAQREALVGYCKAWGLDPLLWAEEVASAGLHPDHRPSLRQCIRVARRAGALLLVSKLDRLSRSVEHIAALMNSSIDFQTVEDGPNVPPMVLHMRAAWAEDERKRIGQRTKEALEAKKARGEALGCRAHKDPSRWASIQPLGWSVARDRANAFALEKYPLLLSLHKSGQTQIQIAETLNKQGVKTFTGRGRWHQSTVGDLMLRAERLTWRK